MDQDSTAGSRPLSDRLIKRPRLLRLLDESQSRLILLVAPAGYGKTTLARQWLTEHSRRSVWFRATPASTDVAALMIGLAKATEDVLEGASNRVHERLRSSSSPNAEADHLGAVLGEDLTNWPANAWVVIDDYHHLAGGPEAERFIDAFATHGPVPLLITSRVRPRWASAKRLLYGEIAELGRNVLAMTHDEAAQAVPRSGAPGALAGLVALAEGWPAVIGLASLVQSPLFAPGDEVPEALHSYFAEELYQEINAELQWNLVQLALSPSIDLELASALFGRRAQEVLEEGYQRGFLNREGDSYDLHPLLRQFLRSKLVDVDPGDQAATVEAISRSCLRRAAWDEAFALAAEFQLRDVLKELFTRALDDLLAQGRLATLDRWIDVAHSLIPSEDLVSLAEVEIAFRAGRWREADDKARELARRLPHSHPLASRALLRAAQVARLADRQEEALELLEEASGRSTTPSDLRRAVWNRFLTLSDLEEPELTAAALREFGMLAPESVEDLIRLSQGHVHFALRWGGIQEELDRRSGALELLDRTVEPVTRSGFLQSYATALNLAARYGEAHALADRQITDAKRYGLDWVQPHALELRGQAQMGLRSFEAAEESLRMAYRLADDAKDVHARLNARTLMARIPLAQGAPSRALGLLDLPARAASPGMDGEIRSMRALTLACMGRVKEADSEIQASVSVTSHLEARCLRAFAGVVIAHALADREACVERLHIAIREASTTGNADALVLAYRAFPPLLHLIGQAGISLDEFLLRPIHTYDAKLAETAGLAANEPRPVSGDDLTKREEEVLSLLQQGLSNREIARALWITESTVKVHVRHIFEKLGVRSRTAAARFRSERET